MVHDGSRAFVEALVGGEYDRAVSFCTDELTDAYPAAGMENDWQELLEQLGPCTGVDGYEAVTARGHEATVATLRFASGTKRLRLVHDGGDVAGLQYLPPGDGAHLAPAYADADRFEEREFAVATDDGELPGTLATPIGERTAAALLVHGSGPLDRDGTAGSSKPLRDLAQGLAAAGVATLRYDKRSAVRPVPPAEHTVDRIVVDDAIAAVAALESAVDIEPVVVGHSLGGMVAPRVVDATGAAGCALLAANARPLPVLVREQCRQLSADRDLPDWVGSAVDRLEDGTVEPDEYVLGFPGAFWRSLDGYDPVPVARDLDRPVGIRQGDEDRKVSPERDYGRWVDELGGCDHVDCTRYAGLDHLFRSTSTTVDGEFVTDLVDWVEVACRSS